MSSLFTLRRQKLYFLAGGIDDDGDNFDLVGTRVDAFGENENCLLEVRSKYLVGRNDVDMSA